MSGGNTCPRARVCTGQREQNFPYRLDAVFEERRRRKSGKDHHAHIQVGETHQKIRHGQVPHLRDITHFS